MINKITRFIKKPKTDQLNAIKHRLNRLSAWPFFFGRANLWNKFIAYQPDSQVTFNRHSEYYELFKSFSKHNKLNNSGDIARLWSFILNIKQVINENIPGQFAELGVWRGNTAAVLAYYAATSGKKVYLFDTFEGFDNRDLAGVDKNKEIQFADTSVAMVKNVIGKHSYSCEFIKGYFPSSISEHHKTLRFSVVSLDCDLYEPMKAGLEFFYPLMSRGGIFLLHDYSSMHWEGAKKAIDEFCINSGEFVILMPDKSGSAFVRKSR